MTQPTAEEVPDSLIVVISREEVQSLNIEPALSTLRRLLETPETALTYMEQVDIAFHGYDDDPRELFEINEVREYAHKLDDQFPYWLFFLSKHRLGLQCLMFCFLLPYLTDAARAELHPRQLEELVNNRWGPALSQISEYAGLSEQEMDEIADRALTYFVKGRFGSSSNP